MRLVACLLLLLAPATASAWIADGVPLCRAPDTQQSPLICSDGTGGAYVAWNDARQFSTNQFDVFLQHITAAGEIAPGWPPDGLGLVVAPGNQGRRGLVADGVGGVLVCWIDTRIDRGDLYLQRVTANGELAPSWPTAGLPVCTAAGQQSFVQLASDGAGGAFMVWDDRRTDNDAYIQHVLGDGTLAAGWPVNGRPLDPTFGVSGLPLALPDGSGGVFAAWGADRPGGMGGVGRAQHLLFSGESAPSWPADGVVTCGQAPWACGPPSAMATDGSGGFYTVWDDVRADPIGYNDYDVYAQHVTSAGSTAPGWPSDGLPLGSLLGVLQWDSKGCEDGFGGFYAAWEDYRAGYAQTFIVRVGPGGQRLPGWPENGRLLSPEVAYQLNASLAPDGLGGVYVAWMNYTNTYHVFIQHLTGSGAVAQGWGPGGLALVRVQGTQQNPTIAADGLGGAILAWEDGRVGAPDWDIYAQRVVNDGLVAVEISMVGAEAAAAEVRLHWFAPDGANLTAAVYRRTEQSDWQRLGTITADGTGRLEFVDRAVTPGARYAYRLGIASGSGESFTAESWVEVPLAFSLALEGLRPNPSVGPLQAAFTLPSGSPATLELLDVSGRRILARDVGALGPGRHAIRLDAGHPIPTGLYWLRLTQGGERRLAKAIVVR